MRSFYDTNANGDGDLRGLVEKLDYLNDGDPNTTDDLGITGLWLMPIMTSPSYHGYDVVNYYNIEEDYGTLNDFKLLMEEAHKRGIRVIIDLVLNHTSSQHPWFRQSKDNPGSAYRDWYVWADENPGFVGPWGQKVWIPGGNGYYYAVFWDGMPDLNYRNPEVTEKMYDVTRFWVEEMGVDGFRLDAIKYLLEEDRAMEDTPDTFAWFEDYQDYYKSIDPDAFTVGEIWSNTSRVLAYVDDQVDVAFEFDLARAYIEAARGPLATPLIEQIQLVTESYPRNQYAVFLTNHDQNRVMSQLSDKPERAKMAATLLLTSPGIPFLYYGEEIGMTGVDPHEDIRRPMQWDDTPNAGFTTGQPWRDEDVNYESVNVAAQMDDPNSLLSHYRNLIHLRNDHPALMYGEYAFVETGSPRLYSFLRFTEGEAILVIVNVNPNPTKADRYTLSLAEGPLSGDLRAEVLFGSGNPVAPQINAMGGFDAYIPVDEIPGQSALIIQLTP